LGRGVRAGIRSGTKPEGTLRGTKRNFSTPQGNPPGQNGTLTVGKPGTVGLLTNSIGGGILIFGHASGATHTHVSGNSATVDPNIDGTFSP